uniref:Uncharacterized protein n=1 Tax=Caenorhabditis japonica TaxID=281687 RepID=A0A8R1HTC5_CAEJA
MAVKGIGDDIHFHVNDVPHFTEIILFGLQQMLVCISGLLVTPYLLSNMLCAGVETLAIRVQIIAATFVTTGIATILQSTFGLRLAILHGPSFAFLPALHTFQQNYPCTSDTDPMQWRDKMQLISGSLFIATFLMPLFGITGLIGKISRYIGPVTIVPILVLLCVGTVPDIEQKVSLHWISVLELVLLISFVVLLENVEVPIPIYSFKEKKIKTIETRIFGQFPYLLGIAIVWFVCYILTVSNLIPEGSAARTDHNESIRVLQQTPWVQVPYPFAFGFPKFNVALAFAFTASTIACMIESVGNYGFMLIFIGVFSKVSALLATIPEAIIGGVLATGMSLICGVAFANLQSIDLGLSRNLTIIGLSIILGCTIPAHFEKSTGITGNETIDDSMGTLLKMGMLVGGLIAFLLDTIAPGATRKQRGFQEETEFEIEIDVEKDGFALSSFANRAILKVPSITKLPVVPSKESIKRIEELRMKKKFGEDQIIRGKK